MKTGAACVPTYRYGISAFLVSICLLATTPVSAGQINVTVTGVVPNGTSVFAALCTSSLDPGTCQTGDRTSATGSVVRFSFENVTPGRVAVAAFQDLDGSGSIER